METWWAGWSSSMTRPGTPSWPVERCSSEQRHKANMRKPNTNICERDNILLAAVFLGQFSIEKQQCGPRQCWGPPACVIGLFSSHYRLAALAHTCTGNSLVNTLSTLYSLHCQLYSAVSVATANHYRPIGGWAKQAALCLGSSWHEGIASSWHEGIARSWHKGIPT